MGMPLRSAQCAPAAMNTLARARLHDVLGRVMPVCPRLLNLLTIILFALACTIMCSQPTHSMSCTRVMYRAALANRVPGLSAPKNAERNYYSCGACPYEPVPNTRKYTGLARALPRLRTRTVTIYEQRCENTWCTIARCGRAYRYRTGTAKPRIPRRSTHRHFCLARSKTASQCTASCVTACQQDLCVLVDNV